MFEYRSGIEIHLMRKTHPDKGDEDEGEQRISSGLQRTHRTMWAVTIMLFENIDSFKYIKGA